VTSDAATTTVVSQTVVSDIESSISDSESIFAFVSATESDNEAYTFDSTYTSDYSVESDEEIEINNNNFYSSDEEEESVISTFESDVESTDIEIDIDSDLLEEITEIASEQTTEAIA
jgi:hypothetical protein